MAMPCVELTWAPMTGRRDRQDLVGAKDVGRGADLTAAEAILRHA